MKKFFVKNWMDIIAIVLSVIALGTSIASNISASNANRIAQNANVLSEQLYYESSVPVWFAEIDNEIEDIHVFSHNPEIYMQSAEIYFPEELDEFTRPVSAPMYSFSIHTLFYSIGEFLNEIIERDTELFLLNDEWYIPIVIDSIYTVRGVVNRDISLYYLSYQFVMDGSNKLPPTVNFRGLYLVEHLDIDSDYISILNKFWDRIVELITSNDSTK